MDFDNMKIALLVRDCNGKRTTWTFRNREDFIRCSDDTATAFISNEDEILMVWFETICVYTALCSYGDSLTLEDLIGFFA